MLLTSNPESYLGRCYVLKQQLNDGRTHVSQQNTAQSMLLSPLAFLPPIVHLGIRLPRPASPPRVHWWLRPMTLSPVPHCSLRGPPRTTADHCRLGTPHRTVEMLSSNHRAWQIEFVLAQILMFAHFSWTNQITCYLICLSMMSDPQCYLRVIQCYSWSVYLFVQYVLHLNL